MKKIHDNNTKGKMKVKVNNFKTMVNGAKRIKLKKNLQYALTLKFLEGLENEILVTRVEKLNLKNRIETEDGDTRYGDLVYILTKSLNHMKIQRNRVSPFKRDEKFIDTTYMDSKSRQTKYDIYKNNIKNSRWW